MHIPLLNSKSKISILLSVLLFALCAFPFVFSQPRTRGTTKNALLEKVRVESSSGLHFVDWSANEAVKFSFDQVVATIRYLFAAAAAGMAFVGKIVIEPRTAGSSGASSPLTRTTQYVLVVANLFWLASLSCGMMAHLFLAEVSVIPVFSIYDSVGIFVFFQISYFLLGLLIFIVALVSTI